MSKTYSIAICTLGENSNLMRVVQDLKSIKQQSKPQIEILLVVNSEVREFFFDSEVQVTFEPKRGYANVRNAALRQRKKNTNLIFIDDDEVPTLTWFESLVEKHEKFPRDIIFGPVYPASIDDLDSYRTQFTSEFRSLPDEALVKQCATANMLIPSELIDSGHVYFDPFFNVSGGEDTDLCFRLRRQGIKIRYAKDALLTELEPEERRNSEYLDLRMLKEVTNYSLVIRRNSSFSVISWRFMTLGLRAVGYAALGPFNESAQKNSRMFFRSLMALVSGRQR